MTGTTERRSEHIKFSGRILFLTDDTALIRQQLEAGGDAAAALEAELAARLLKGDLPLMSNISTDEITPGWVCFYYDETLGQYVYVGMRESAVRKTKSGTAGLLSSFRDFQRVVGRRARLRPTPRKPPAFSL